MNQKTTPDNITISLELLTNDEIYNAGPRPNVLFKKHRIEFARAVEQAVLRKNGVVK